MSLISLVVVLIVLGVLMWLINSYIPMDPKFKTLVNVVVIIFVVIWLIQSLGLLAPLGQIRIR